MHSCPTSLPASLRARLKDDRCLGLLADDLHGNVQRSLNADEDLGVPAGLASFVAWAIAMCHTAAVRRLAGVLVGLNV